MLHFFQLKGDPPPPPPFETSWLLLDLPLHPPTRFMSWPRPFQPPVLRNYYFAGRPFPRMRNKLHIDPHYKATSGRCHAILYFITRPQPPFKHNFKVTTPSPTHVHSPDGSQWTCTGLRRRRQRQPRDTLIETSGKNLLSSLATGKSKQ
jgi:hypothetical protein